MRRWHVDTLNANENNISGKFTSEVSVQGHNYESLTSDEVIMSFESRDNVLRGLRSNDNF